MIYAVPASPIIWRVLYRGQFGKVNCPISIESVIGQNTRFLVCASFSFRVNSLPRCYKGCDLNRNRCEMKRAPVHIDRRLAIQNVTEKKEPLFNSILCLTADSGRNYCVSQRLREHVNKLNSSVQLSPQWYTEQVGTYAIINEVRRLSLDEY